MDRLEAMTAFVSVVENGGFSAAARKLGMPLTTVSRKVSELEDALKAQLLVRTTRSVATTETGRVYFETCRRVLEELAEADRLAAGEYQAPKGLLAVGAPLVFGRLYLAPIIIEFLRAYPDVDVELRLSDSVVGLVEEQVDVALRIGDLADSSLIALRAGEIRHVTCAAPAYLERRGVPEHPRDLMHHDCITFTALQSPAEWTFLRGNRAERHPVRSRLVVNSAETAVAAAVAGLGVTRLLCYQAARAIDAKALTLFMRACEPPALPVQLVYPHGRLVPRKLRAFLDFVHPRLKASLVFDP